MYEILFIFINLGSFKILMVLRYGRVVTYHEGLPQITSLDPWITWFFEITRQAKMILSSNQSDYGVEISLSGGLLWDAHSYRVTWLLSHVVLWDHLTNLKHISTTTMSVAIKFSRYFHPFGTWLFDHVVFPDHGTN